MVSLNEDTLMLMGGFVPGLTTTNNAWAYHISNNTWNTAQSMNTGRAHHSCSVMKATPQESAKVIVVGGSIDNGSNTNSVEIYDPLRNIWETGPSMPIPIKYSQMTGDKIKGGVLLIGGRTSDAHWGILFVGAIEQQCNGNTIF